MADNVEFISPTDQPALLGVSNLEWLARIRADLTALGYKVITAANHEDFLGKFSRVHYKVVVLEYWFASSNPTENASLGALQRMSMAQRRHAVILLLGQEFQSMNAMQAFQQSVQAVVNPAELSSFKVIVQQVLADNDAFLQVFRDTLTQVSAWGK